MRRLVLLASLLALLIGTGTAGAQAARSWAAPQIEAVVGAGLMASSADDFRPQDQLTSGELATVLAALGTRNVLVADPDKPVTVRELDARLVSVAGLRREARGIRLAASAAGLTPPSWLGTETVARLLGLRINHLKDREELELQISQPATRAEAAFSVARLLELQPWEIDAVRENAAAFTLPPLTGWQRTVLRRALRFVGSPYVWGGMSEKPQQLFGKLVPGGFDCSGFVWRIFKLEPFAGAPGLSATLRGRTSFDMSGEVGRPLRLTRDALEPADIAFFGLRGPRSKPAQVGHMGIYLGNGWIVHSSGTGTTLQPMTGWYETTFAWGRSPLREAGLSGA